MASAEAPPTFSPEFLEFDEAAVLSEEPVRESFAPWQPLTMADARDHPARDYFAAAVRAYQERMKE